MIAGASIAQAAATVAVTTATHSWAVAVSQYVLVGALWALVFGLIGALVLRETPGNSLGPLFSAMGGWMAAESLAASLANTVATTGWLHGTTVWFVGLWTPPAFAFLIVPILYPYGRPMSARWRRLLRLSVIGATVSTFALAVSRHIVDGHPEVRNPFQVPVADPVVLAIAGGGALLVLAIAFAAVVAQLWTMRHGSPSDRARVAWLVSSLALTVLGVGLDAAAPSLAVQLLAAGCLACGIVRHRLFDIETVLTRSLVYAFAVSASLAVALIAAALLGSGSGIGVVPALAAAVTSLVLASAHSRIRGLLDRLLFGRRDDPARALIVLGERLASSPTPDDVLPTVVTTLREALRLPYAAVTLVEENESAAEDGTAPERQVCYALQYGGHPVGSLHLGLRRGERALSAADERLVVTFAAQAGAAAHGAQITRDLRRSRERLVAAREEERRSLRRDLHDGIGPVLAGMALGLQSLQRGASSAEQARLASDLCDQAEASLVEVRRLARDLRPSALDELGLVAAVRQHAERSVRFLGGTPRVQVMVPEPLPDLPAAVEVAAYRIVQEGLANIVRHARARSCSVTLRLHDALIICVEDDGTGAVPHRAGAGLRSMRERAEELGGECTVTFRTGSGTTVRAVLPLSVVAPVADEPARRN